jgi:hypothetical protein
MGLEETVMDEARLQAYVNLIEQLLTCADDEELNNILQANQELIDPEFLQVMENYATGLEQQGNNNPAAWLRNMAQQLGQYLNPQAGSIEEYQGFLSEVLQAEYESNDPAVVYPILQRRQHLLNDTFAQLLQQYARKVFSQRKAEEVVSIAGVIQNLCLGISEFPLGSRANNKNNVFLLDNGSICCKITRPYGTRFPKSLVLLAPEIGPDSVDKFSQILSY